MADYIYIADSGVIVPDTSVVETQVQDEFKAIFGSDLNVDPRTPQGALIVNETIARTTTLRNNAQIANQINPNLAGGVALDAILALTGTQRITAQFTTVAAILTGQPGAPVPALSQAQEIVNNEVFELIADVVLDLTGTAVGEFRALNSGAISCLANTLTKVVSGVLGWETVNNPDAGNLGETTQSDVQARAERNVTLAAQGASLAEAIISQLYLTEGVTRVSFRENISSSTEVIGGVTMIPHSIYAVVEGGTDFDVATSIALKKSGGCAYNNGLGDNISQLITQPFSGQVQDILFDRPLLVQILVQITVTPPASIQDPTSIVKQAILDYQDGLIPGMGKLNIGTPVSAFELGAAVVEENPAIVVRSVGISLVSPLNFSCAEIPIQIWERAYIISSNISVIVT